ncbi:MAG: hypothetical protein Q8O35_09305 [Humidesulfovibrio sp.]|uniref:hypothetical protein n=1 Tax=Humidesulfovibrio sp. TaxID=2910988 RepID=UPI00273667B4|nr:hypothetical protein [Humidesulfovibrio sp.]MDP2848377.1 hypothetical protein [Humidesulfovibrio sp.]
MSPMSDIVLVPQSTQLLAMAVALQFVAFMTVLWRGIFGMKQLSTRRPRWPFIPLVAGTACGVWYAWIQQDLVFGAAQGLALFLGFCLLNSTRGEQPSGGQFTGKRSERRAAEREAKRARKSSGE